MPWIAPIVAFVDPRNRSSASNEGLREPPTRLVDGLMGFVDGQVGFVDGQVGFVDGQVGFIEPPKAFLERVAGRLAP